MLRALTACLLMLLLGGCTAPAVSGSPAPSAIATSTLSPSPTPTIAAMTSASAVPVSPPSTVEACGSLVRYASDGNFKLLNIDRQGTVSQYLLQVGHGSAPDDLGTANQNPFLVRITGSRLPPSTGNPEATYLTDYAVTRLTRCP